MSFSTNCEGISRRNCLQLGLGSFMGTTFVNTLRARGESAKSSPGLTPTAKSCILVWMDGGPSHFETFDPKPNAPSEIRGEFETIKTSVSGIHFSEHMTGLAPLADKFSVIRSIRHNQGNHGAGNHYMMTGAPTRIPVSCGAYVSFHPSMGSVASHELGVEGGLPPYFSLPSMARSGGPNFLGAKYAPFVVSDDPNNQQFKVRDVALPKGLSEGRFAKRTDLRKMVDKLQRINHEAAADPVLGLDEYYQQGHNLVTSTNAQKAFDMSKESDETRERYGRNSFGQRALLARRLVEADVPFITIVDGGWDDHAGIFPDLKKRLPAWTNTLGALIQDLDERGLLDSTLVVALGEFGRTPKISKLPTASEVGRDHWSNAMSVFMAGGGTPGGTVIGATDRKGFSAVDHVLSPENFVSTVYTKLGIDPNKMFYTPQGRPSHLVSDPTPIHELC